MSEKKTLGQQWLDVQNEYAGKKTQTVRETTNEMGKDYMESLFKVIKDHEHLKEPYYIIEVLKPDSFLEGVIKLTHIARRTKPRSQWGIAVFEVNNEKGECKYLWGLPKAEEAFIMMQNPEGWDQKLVEDIKNHLDGKLV